VVGNETGRNSSLTRPRLRASSNGKDTSSRPVSRLRLAVKLKRIMVSSAASSDSGSAPSPATRPRRRETASAPAAAPIDFSGWQEETRASAQTSRGSRRGSKTFLPDFHTGLTQAGDTLRRSREERGRMANDETTAGRSCRRSDTSRLALAACVPWSCGSKPPPRGPLREFGLT
jgi:hypothetical protein